MFIIVSGPAAVGKNTVITKLLSTFENLELMQTCTTRARRSTDSDMHNPYIYLTREEFEAKIKNGELFEHEEVHGNLMGALNASVMQIKKREKDYIKDIGVLGQVTLKRAVRRSCEVVSIFLKAPKEVLVKRLQERGDKDIEKRISRMEFEESYAKNYDYVIDNMNLERTFKKVVAIIKRHKKIEQKRFAKKPKKLVKTSVK